MFVFYLRCSIRTTTHSILKVRFLSSVVSHCITHCQRCFAANLDKMYSDSYHNANGDGEVMDRVVVVKIVVIVMM